MKKTFLSAAVLAAAGVLFSAPSQAQTAGAADGMQLTLGYEGRLYVKILSVELQQQVGPRAFQSDLRITAEGPLAVFKKLDVRASSEGVVSNGMARPEMFTYRSRSGSKERTLRSEWTGGDVVTSAAPAFASMGDPPASRSQRAEGADPVTQLMRIALAAQPCSGSHRFFDGKQRYNLVMSPRGSGSLDEKQKALGLVNPIRCQARHEKVAGFKPKTAAEDDAVSMKDMAMEFAQVGKGGPWVVTSVTVGTGLGPARIRLQRLSARGAEAEQVARLRGGQPG